MMADVLLTYWLQSVPFPDHSLIEVETQRVPPMAVAFAVAFVAIQDSFRPRDNDLAPSLAFLFLLVGIPIFFSHSTGVRSVFVYTFFELACSSYAFLRDWEKLLRLETYRSCDYAIGNADHLYSIDKRILRHMMTSLIYRERLAIPISLLLLLRCVESKDS
jgi:hypothetical protein